MPPVPGTRHLLRAKDLADSRYFEALSVADMARAAGLSKAHFSREFSKTFGEPPHQYLLTRRLERAAALLRTTDWPVARICFAVGLESVGSFTTSFRRLFGQSPTVYRAGWPPAARLVRNPALRSQGLRSTAEPHVPRRRPRGPRLRLRRSVHTYRKRQSDQVRELAVLRARPGRGTHVLAEVGGREMRAHVTMEAGRLHWPSAGSGQA